jgi:hypothetical protein
VSRALGCHNVGVAQGFEFRRFCSVTRIEDRSKANESDERQGASRRLKRRDLLAIPAASALPLTTLASAEQNLRYSKPTATPDFSQSSLALIFLSFIFLFASLRRAQKLTGK